MVGDTFPVGCAYSDSVVFPEFFVNNPDYQMPRYQTDCGMYTRGCSLENAALSWGHDEYLYNVVKDHLPTEALYMIRYHSFYPWHKEGAYSHLLTRAGSYPMLPWVKRFNPYDLYSKATEKPDQEKLKPFYQELIGEYFRELAW